jgi:hypothetical protein
MKKIMFSFLVLAVSFTAKAQVDGFFPQYGQDAQWTVNEQFELVFSGDVLPAPNAAIATTFEGMVSDGIGGNDFTGLNMKFDATIFDLAGNTSIILGYNGLWDGAAGRGVFLEFSQWLCQGTINFSYGAGNDKWMITDPSSYQSAVVKNGYNSFEIDVDATGLVKCKLNGYVCDVPYQAPLELLKPTETSTFFVLFANNFTGFKMKNLVVTKGGVTNKYFVDPSIGIINVSQESIDIYPNPSKGVFTIVNIAAGQKYQVTNMLGQQIESGVINSSDHKLDLTSKQKGIYFVTIKGINGKMVKKIIKD